MFATVFNNILNLFGSTTIIAIFSVILVLAAIGVGFEMHQERSYGWLMHWGMRGAIAISAATIGAVL